MKRTIIASLLLMSSPVFANPTFNNSSADAVSLSVAQSAAAANSQSTAIGIGGQGGVGYGGLGLGLGEGGNSTAYGGSSTVVSGGNVTSQTVNAGMQPGTYNFNYAGRLQQPFQAYAPALFPTAPCMGTSSGGLGTYVFGFSGGTSWRSLQCEYLEASKAAPTFEDRVYTWCKTDAAKGAPSCKQFEVQSEAKISVPVSVAGEGTDASVWNQ